MSVLPRIAALRSEAERAIVQASSTEALEAARVRYLGRRAELPQLLRGVAELPPEERGAVGRAANEARRALETLLTERAAELDARELDAQLIADRVDVTLPGTPPQPVGRLHLLTATQRELEDVFLGLGFTVLEGREVELVHYNFDALNHSPNHPARSPIPSTYSPPAPRRPAGTCCAATPPTSSCAPTPRRCRCAPWRPTRRRCTWSSPGGCIAPTPTPRTRRSFIRSRVLPWTRTSPWPT